MPRNGVINNWRPALTQSETGRSESNSLRQALSLLVAAARPERMHFIKSVLFLLLAVLLDVLLPLLNKLLIDNYLIPHHLALPQMVQLLLAGLVLGSVATLIRYAQLTRLAGLAMRSVQRLRQQVYDHVLNLPMAFFDTAITGQLVSRVTNDTEAVKSLYVQVLFVMLDSSIMLVGAFIAMVWLDWRLTGIVLFMVPTALAITWAYQRLSAPAVARARQFRSDINAQMAESIGGMSLLQAHNATLRYRDRFVAKNQEQYKARLAEIRANAWLLRPVLDLVKIILIASLVYTFGQRSVAGMQIGVLFAFLTYIERVVEPLIQITSQFSQFQQSVVAASRVNTLLQESRPANLTRPELHITKGQLSLKNIEFAYQSGQPILQELNLEIAAGEFFGIVGHTGSGKSTLLSLLLRFYAPQQGSIEVDGIALASLSNQAFREDVALVPQDPFLLAASVYENIDMGRGLSQQAVETAARAARAHEFILQLEQGYLTDLGENGGRLSTGQKQLIAIARALAGQPKILLLDEATSHIDSETEQVVQQALSELRGKVTLVAIAHRLSTVRDADHIIVLNHGRIAERGNHDSLMQIDNGIYQRLYLLQQFVTEQ
jgi:ATP-binding cassette subfamily B protein/ATP-binding cassette subfamily C protein/ATP-binding cassette subfamily B multidrug efflux pump